MPQSLRGALQAVHALTWRSSIFLPWLECTMLACELVSIGFSDIVINDVEHVHVCVDHRVRGDASSSCSGGWSVTRALLAPKPSLSENISGGHNDTSMDR